MRNSWKLRGARRELKVAAMRCIAGVLGERLHSGDLSDRGYCPNSRLAPPNPQPRSGISLLEVLLSMFVLLFGLMGVAALFPVGNHFIRQGEKFERGTGLAQNAFDELTSRGILRPEFWLYADGVPTVFINNGAFQIPFGAGNNGPGLAYVIDPLSSAQVPATNGDLFPFGVVSSTSGVDMPPPWANAFATLNPPSSVLNQPGDRWPVRRLTLPTTAPLIPMTTAVAETIFRLRDDISVEKPDEDDHPSMQLWRTADPNNTPTDLTDDTLLSRQYHGNYSWLATVVPTSGEALAGLQPADAGYSTYYYDVSVVVFYKRDEVPSAASERLIEAQLLPGGELEIFSDVDPATDAATVDAAVEDIRAGNWIAITGVNQVTGDFMLKWYRLLSLDEETSASPNISGASSRFAMLAGPEWPNSSITDLRAVLLPGAISVSTKQMKME